MYGDESEELIFTITEDKVSCDYGTLDYEIDGEGAVVSAISVYRKRQGIGRRLVELFEELALRENAKFVEVPASPTKEAVLFWRSMKYKPSTNDDKYWALKIVNGWREGSWDTPQGVVVMEKSFKKTISQRKNK